LAIVILLTALPAQLAGRAVLLTPTPVVTALVNIAGGRPPPQILRLALEAHARVAAKD
jgi:hypothetical protein